MAKNRNNTQPVVEETPTVVEEVVESTENAIEGEAVETPAVVEEVVETPVVTEEEIVEPVINDEVVETPEIKDEEPVVNPEDSEETPPAEIKEETPEVKTYDPEVNLLNDANASMEDKINWCLQAAPAKLKNIAMQLKSYNEAMKPGAIHDEQRMLGKQYELVSIFRAVFNSATYNEFKAKFDVLNLFFSFYAKEAFAAHYLSRFDYLWKWTDAELETLLNVSEVVSQLCYYPERAKRLKQLNLEMALDSKKTIVSEEVRNYIIKYYGK